MEIKNFICVWVKIFVPDSEKVADKISQKRTSVECSARSPAMPHFSVIYEAILNAHDAKRTVFHAISYVQATGHIRRFSENIFFQ